MELPRCWPCLCCFPVALAFCGLSLWHAACVRVRVCVCVCVRVCVRLCVRVCVDIRSEARGCKGILSAFQVHVLQPFRMCMQISGHGLFGVSWLRLLIAVLLTEPRLILLSATAVGGLLGGPACLLEASWHCWTRSLQVAKSFYRRSSKASWMFRVCTGSLRCLGIRI